MDAYLCLGHQHHPSVAGVCADVKPGRDDVKIRLLFGQCHDELFHVYFF